MRVDPARRSLHGLAAALGTLTALTLLAAPRAQQLVKDINPGIWPFPWLAEPESFASTGTTVFFVTWNTSDDQNHSLLWRTDGTATGTVVVHDFGRRANVRGVAVLGSTVYLTVTDEAAGLWRSDGTPEGTVMLRAFDWIGEIAAVGGMLYLHAGTLDYGRELWQSDGTAQGTVLAADIRPGPASSGPRSFRGVRGTLMFVADDGENGIELFRFDSGDRPRVLDLRPGPDSSEPRDLTIAGQRLFLTAVDATAGRELWCYDGSSAPRVADLARGPAGSDPRELTAVGGRVFFSADDGVRGRELWVSDGTPPGTNLVRDIRPGGSGSDATPLGLIDVQGELFFSADDGASGAELWRSDGTAAGTRLVTDLVPGSAGSFPRPVIARGETLFFRSHVTPASSGLYRVDAATSTVGLVAPVSAHDAVPLGPRAFVFRGSRVGTFAELWKSDGTTAGTVPIVDELLPRRPRDASPWDLVALGGRLLFGAHSEATGSELWQSDGTADGTTVVTEIVPGPRGSGARLLTRSDDVVYFVADDGIHGPELWKTDGTAAGTAMVMDIRPGSAPSFVEGLTASPGRQTVAFAAWDGVHGYELWWSDGTAAGTRMVTDINPGSTSGVWRELHVMDGHVYFVADDGVHGLELWRSDGTAQGTHMVSDIHDGSEGSITTFQPVDRGGVLFFAADDGVHGREPWQTDGTAAGTRLVTDVAPGIAGSSPWNLTKSGGNVYFTAATSAAGRELWTIDGVEADARLVRDVYPGAGWSDPHPLVPAGGRLFFSAYEPTGGRELYVTDGTAASTTRVDIEPGPAGSIERFAAIAPLGTGARVIFSARRGPSGQELWRSDGTAAGTSQIADLARPDPFGSTPHGLLRIGRTIFFAAETPTTGVELFAVDLATAGGVLVEPYGRSSVASDGSIVRLRAIHEPTLGTANFAVALSRTLPTAPAIVVVSWAPVEVPLGPLGCDLLVQLPGIGFPGATNIGGSMRVTLPIPDDPLLRGVELFCQGAVLDTGGCVFGAASVSHGLHVMLND